MKNLWIPLMTLAIISIMPSCDMKHKGEIKTGPEAVTYSVPIDADEGDYIQSEEEIIEKADVPNYGAAAGPAAAGNEKFTTKRQNIQKTQELSKVELLNDIKNLEERPLDDFDYFESDRQAMEEYDETWDTFESPDEKLDRLQQEEAIFYGYPGATGASGALGSEKMEK